MVQDIRIIEINQTHFSKIVNICDKVIGAGYLNPKLLHTLIKSKKYRGVVTLLDNNITGFCIWKIFQKKEELPQNLKNLSFFETLPAGKALGYVKLIGVEEQFQRKGFGSLMIQKCMKDLKTSCSSILCTAWKNRNGTNLESILVANKFVFQETVKNFWYESSMENNFRCASCGIPPCTCSLDIYLLFI